MADDNFEQDWADVASGNYALDELASNADLSGLDWGSSVDPFAGWAYEDPLGGVTLEGLNQYDNLMLPGIQGEMVGPGFFTDTNGYQREMTPEELQYQQTGGTTFDTGDGNRVVYEPSGTVRTETGDQYSYYTPDGGYVRYEDITNPNALVESYGPSGRYGAWHDGVYVDYTDINKPGAAVNTYGPTGSGATQTTYKSGSVEQVGKDGTRFITAPDGKTTVIRPDGTQQTYKNETAARAGTTSSETGMGKAKSSSASNASSLLPLLLMMLAMNQRGGSSGASNAVIPQLNLNRSQLPYGQAIAAARQPVRKASGGIITLAEGGSAPTAKDKISPTSVLQQALSMAGDNGLYQLFDYIPQAIQRGTNIGLNSLESVEPGGFYGNDFTSALSYIGNPSTNTQFLQEAQQYARMLNIPIEQAIPKYASEHASQYPEVALELDMLSGRVTPEQARSLNSYIQTTKNVNQLAGDISGYQNSLNSLQKKLDSEMAKPAGQPQYDPVLGGYAKNTSDFRDPSTIAGLQEQIRNLQGYIDARSSSLQTGIGALAEAYPGLQAINSSFKATAPTESTLAFDRSHVSPLTQQAQNVINSYLGAPSADFSSLIQGTLDASRNERLRQEARVLNLGSNPLTAQQLGGAIALGLSGVNKPQGFIDEYYPLLQQAGTSAADIDALLSKYGLPSSNELAFRGKGSEVSSIPVSGGSISRTGAYQTPANAGWTGFASDTLRYTPTDNAALIASRIGTEYDTIGRDPALHALLAKAIPSTDGTSATPTAAVIPGVTSTAPITTGTIPAISAQNPYAVSTPTAFYNQPNAGGPQYASDQILGNYEVRNPYAGYGTTGRRPGSSAIRYFSNTTYAQGGSVNAGNGGGISSLGAYASGGRGRLVSGPGDGVSDDIPATIDGKQPAKIASGEYVLDSRTVAAAGNGSTEAGARRLDEMRDRILAADRKAGIGEDSKAYKHLLA